MKTQQYPQDLGNGLQLRWAAHADNKQLVELAFHALDEGESCSPFVKFFVQDWVDGKFPLLHHEDITVVEDTTRKKIVSSMCLFSETWRYGDTHFKVGRPELVMTHEDFRRRGLIHAQFEVIHALSAARGEVMQVITGIPSLYRQWGYEMCLELGGGYRIFPPSFPKLTPEAADDYRLRPASSKADRVFIKELHDANTRSMLFSMDVPEATWAFEFDSYRDGSDGKFHWLIIEDKAGTRLGYLQHSHIFWGSFFDINFLALKPGIGYLNLLPHLLHGLWNIAQQKFVDDTFEHPAEQIRGLYMRLGRKHPIYEAIGRDTMLKTPAYAWYVRFPDVTRYLKTVKAQLERHLAESPGVGYNGDLRLNFYRAGTLLKFKDGAIEIEDWQPPDGSTGDAHFPVHSFSSLLCGQKTASQLTEGIPDCWMNRTARALLNFMFPPFNGQVWVVGGGG